MKTSVLATCQFKEEQDSFIAELLSKHNCGNIDIKRLVRKLSNSCSSTIKQIKPQNQTNTTIDIQKQERSSIEISKSKIKGSFVINQLGCVYIYGCQSVADAYKLALLTMREINRALKLQLKMLNFKVLKIKTQFYLQENIDLSLFKNFDSTYRQIIKEDKTVGIQFINLNGFNIKRYCIFSNGRIEIQGKQQEQIKARYLQILKFHKNNKKNMSQQFNLLKLELENQNSHEKINMNSITL